MLDRVIAAYTDSSGSAVMSDTESVLWGHQALTVELGSETSRVPFDAPLGWVPASYPFPGSGWGLALQLYSLSGPSSAGIGDFGVLAEAASVAKEAGASFLLLNPICMAPTSGSPRQDPYAPGTRLFRDPIYLDVEQVALDEDTPMHAGHRQKLESLRQGPADLVAWDLVRATKDAILRDLYARSRSASAGFQEYMSQLPRESVYVAAFLAAARRHGPKWWRWEANADVSPDHCTEYGSDESYELWLQWQILKQLHDVQRVLPVLIDMPVGVAPDGPDCWLWPNAIARQAELGAPPDGFSSDGQNWHVHGWHPEHLRAEGYRPLRVTVRESLRGVAGLRLDHVMGYQRIFWIPCGSEPSRGVYIAHDLSEGLELLMSEVRQTGSFVFGEDLGTVSDEMRMAMRAHDIPGFRLLYLDVEGKTFVRETVGMVSNHDTPTSRGLICGGDVAFQRSAGIDCDITAQQELLDRVSSVVGTSGSCESRALGLYRRLADVESRYLAVQVEDVLGIEHRPHFPGAAVGPMWDRRHPLTVKEWSGVPLFREVADVMSTARAQ